MRVTIISVGKWKNCPEREIFEEYKKRLPWKIDLIEVDEKKAKNILEFVPEKSYKIVLDEKGNQFSSKDFASQLNKLQVQGRSKIAFLIGGADGHDKAAIEKADLLFSLGKMTWPHMLVRAMLAEQIYRAFSIISGHPYHRD